MKTPVRLVIRGYSSAGFAGAFIRWFTFGQFSHVSFVFEYANHPPEEFESIQGKGVVHHPPTEGKAYLAFHVPLTPDEIEMAHEQAMTIHGKYDWKGIWGFVVKKKRHSEFKWFCSEYLAYILWKARYPISRREPYRETPSSVRESLRIVRSEEDEDINAP